MKTIKDAKTRLVVGARLLCVENTYRPKLNGTFRTVTKVGASVWKWKGDDDPDPRESHSVWPAGIKIVDADTIRIPMGDDHFVTLRFVAPVTVER